MDVNAALEVIIGLAAMYLLLALICTILNEMMASFRNLRAKSLRKGLDALLNDPKVAGLAQDVRNTPILKKLFETAGKDGPSYIASRQFASGLLEYVRAKLPADTAGVTPADIIAAINALPDSDIKSQLSSFALETAGNIEELRTRISEWYDDFMDRWGGNYKRNAQAWSLALAIVLVLLVNADTFAVAQRLWADPSLRAEAVAIGESLAAQDVEKLNEKTYTDIREQLQSFPLGWDFQQFGPLRAAGEPCSFWQAAGWAILKLGGLAVSALAVALGAPFWFDMLNRLNAIRGAGKKPESTTATS